MLPSPRDSMPPIPVIAPFWTNDGLLALVRFLKFEGGRSAAPPLAWWMSEALRAQGASRVGIAVPRDTILVPVPLHPSRQRERGYNQAALLAAGVAALLGLETALGALERGRKTKCQSTIDSPSERSANVRGAFRPVRPEALGGRRIILVDDLVTTGETVRACADAALACGPASLAVLSAGRVRGSVE
jgi:predicted amidophosphoribosyltransferase